MASREYLPASDAGLLAWTSAFKTRIVATPTAYGLTSAQATAYATAQTAFATALAACTAPETRGGSTCFAKEIAKRALIVTTRALVRQVQGTPTVTNQQRYDLGITVRRVPAPIPVPDKSPAVTVKSVMQNRVLLTLRPPGATTRGKPAGVAGIAVFSHVGPTPPSSIDAWKFEGNTTRTEVLVEFPTSAEPFSTVWLTAFYFNPRGESGVATTPISTNLGTWLVQAENGAASPVKLAA